MLATQGNGSGAERANTALHITFDNLIIEGSLCPTPFLRGDSNTDGGINLADSILILDHLFPGATVDCLAALNVNEDQVVNIADPVYLLSYLFSSGPPPALPFPACEADPTDQLGCMQYVCP